MVSCKPASSSSVWLHRPAALQAAGSCGQHQPRIQRKVTRDKAGPPVSSEVCGGGCLTVLCPSSASPARCSTCEPGSSSPHAGPCPCRHRQVGRQEKQSQGGSQQSAVQGREWEVATDSMAKAPGWHPDALFACRIATARRRARRQTGRQAKGRCCPHLIGLSSSMSLLASSFTAGYTCSQAGRRAGQAGQSRCVWLDRGTACLQCHHRAGMYQQMYRRLPAPSGPQRPAALPAFPPGWLPCLPATLHPP